ncbi:MAG: 1-deoxy-D-xylulose-5-phosphate reductoisomerase [Opitutales bacterium]
MTQRRKNIVLLGATGSIGENTLKVLRAYPDRLRLLGIAGKRQFGPLAAIAREFEVPHACLFDADACQQAQEAGAFPEGTRLVSGMEGLTEVACLDEADLVVMAVVGCTALEPALAALEKGVSLALANKELLVMAGKFVTEAARRNGAELLPVDSEHNAIYQCLHGNPHEGLDRIILTASGGMFRDKTLAEMAEAKPEQALQNPNWDMGPKVTVDSSTMANKGLELIEAHWLFGLPSARIDVVVHPQSIVHSMVQFLDGAILAQLSPPSMTFAVQHALFHPERLNGVQPTLDFNQTFQLDFRPPDLTRFPCLRLAREALEAGGCAPAVFNAANEIAVDAFLDNRLPYLAIPRCIEQVLGEFRGTEPTALGAVLKADAEARALARESLHQLV